MRTQLALAAGLAWVTPALEATIEPLAAAAVLDFLFRVAIRRVVVVREGKPIGVISRSNLLRRFQEWIGQPECEEALA